ncbi:hypothetical protein [Sulfurimonas sp.]|uniref:hypothetical protein n=1 Tax=Sulfurimonas sp. TaxID=2022749 RepID=UPI0035638E8D
MDDMIYPASLVIVAALAFIFYRNKSMIMMLVVLAVGAYIVFSHETGYSSANLKSQIAESIDESVKDYDKSHNMGLSKDEE